MRMITLLKNFFKGLWYDDQAAKRFLRGGIFGMATLASTVAAVFQALPADQAEALWSNPKKLLMLAAPSFLAGLGGLIGVGDKTPQNVKTLAASLDAKAGTQN